MLLLVIIYLAFISLGLPDSLFGVSWPLMHVEFNLDTGFAGVVTIIVILGTVATSLLTGKIIRRIGTGKLTAFSVLLTAIALVGISVSPSIWLLLPFSIMLGIGAGAVDSALNHYVAAHYQPQHMNWLHCFWGIGVTISPLIMSSYLAQDGNWRSGYLTIGLIQAILTIILFISLPLWKRHLKKTTPDTPASTKSPAVVDSWPTGRPIRIRGVLLAMLALGLYCAWENTLGTWGATYLIRTRTIDPAMAAKWISFYYGGIMAGRFIAGFVSFKVGDKIMIRFGLAIAIIGAILLLVPFGNLLTFIALLLIGLGFAPIFPSSIHSTVERFGNHYAPDIVGYQMAGAYSGILILQPTMGWIASKTTFAIMPYLFLVLAFFLALSTEAINWKVTQHPISLTQ